MLAAMTIATGAASMGMEARLFFTFWGTPVLRRPETAPGERPFVERMFGWMLPKGPRRLRFSQMRMAGMGTAMIKRRRSGAQFLGSHPVSDGQAAGPSRPGEPALDEEFARAGKLVAIGSVAEALQALERLQQLTRASLQESRRQAEATAEAALYQAKANGRNRVELAG
jgi:hypothetical protein